MWVLSSCFTECSGIRNKNRWLLATVGGITVYSIKKEKYAYTSLKMLEKCTQLIFLPFDLIVLAKYKGT